MKAIISFSIFLVLLTAGCAAHPQIASVTQIVPVTQIVQVTRVVEVTKIIPLTMEGTQTSTVTASATETPVLQEATPTDGPDSIRFEVSAGLDWQDSQVDVVKGALVSVAYVEGEWTFNLRGGRLFYVGPDGYAGTYVSSLQGKCWAPPMPKAAYGALVARIDYGPAFLIGSRRTFTPDRDGSLYFRINDDCMGDDAGVITIQIDSVEE